MGIKAFQVMLLVAAVLGAIGIIATLASGDTAMPDKFEPPAWLSGLEGLAARPPVNRRELTHDGQPFPPELTLTNRHGREFRVAPDPDTRARRLEFELIQGSATLTFKPARSDEEHVWPDDRYPDADPNFMVREPGGTLLVQPTTRRLRLRVVE